MNKSFLLIFFLIPIFTADFDSDLETVIAGFDVCTPECTFNYSEITSKTIKYFPKGCWEVCGLITLNSNLDLSISQLKETFKDMERLYGGLKIENTSLTTLSFFKEYDDDYSKIYIICPDFGTTVINNNKLTNIEAFNTVVIYGRGQSLGPFRFENNTMADAKKLCEMGYFPNSMDMVVNGNLKDCGCHYHQLSPGSPKSSCIDLYGGLSFSNITDPSTIYDLSKVKRFHGAITIQNSNFQNLSFLSSLKIIKGDGAYDEYKYFLNLKNNPKMTRLAFPSLDTLENTKSGNMVINLENLHPDFCLTAQEIFFFMNTYAITFENLHGKVCELQMGPTDKYPFCILNSLAELENNCTQLYGDLVIGPGDEDKVEKLKNLIFLIGSISVKNTSLESLSFLSNMMNLAALDEQSPAIQLIGNKNLKSSNFSRYLDIWTNKNRFCVIQGNHADLVKSPGSCTLFNTFLGRNNMTYLGDQCGEVYVEDNNNNSTNSTAGQNTGTAIGNSVVPIFEAITLFYILL